MRVEGFDDGFFPVDFKGKKGTTVIAGVELDGNVVTRIGYGTVMVDARDSERVVAGLSKLMTGELVFLDGVTYSGFDVVDPENVHSETGKPVIVVQHYPLNLDRIRKALVKHFPDWAERFRVINKVASSMTYVETPWKPVLIYPVGLSLDKAVELYKKNCIYSPIPEALRIADMVASNISRVRLLNKDSFL